MIRPRSKERALRLIALITGDAMIAWLCLGAAVYIRRHIDFTFTKSILPPEKFALTVGNVLLICASLVIALALSGFYNARVSRRHRPIIGAALLIQVALIAVAATFMQRPYPRTILLLVPLMEVVLLPIWRRTITRLMPVRPRDTVLVGNPSDFAPFLTLLGEGLDQRIRVVGLVGPQAPLGANGWVPYWGNLNDPAIQERLRYVEELIYVSHDDAPQTRLRLLGIRGAPGFLFVPSQSDSLITSATFGWVGDQPLVEISGRCGYGAGALTKRVMDVCFGSLLLLISLPVWLIIALAIYAESGRPVLLRQPRAGRNGSVFQMWKFRTMHEKQTHEDTWTLAREGDERVTRVGLWLRRHRLDELPQLLNVMAGNMSLVGPRPERPEIVAEICRDLPEFDLRLMVRPGLAGLAQVWAEYDTLPATKLRYDLTYICAWSLGLDFRILLRAVSTAMAGRGV